MVDRYEQPLSAEATDRYYQTATTEANNAARGFGLHLLHPKNRPACNTVLSSERCHTTS